MIEKPSVGRSKETEDFKSLKIEIPAKKSWFAIIFISFWMGGWAIGEILAIRKIFYPYLSLKADAFLLFWLAAWTAAGLHALYALLWNLIGKEIITIKRGIIKIEKSVLGIGRKKSFEIKFIKNLDINPTPTVGIFALNSNLSGSKIGKIKFNYGMKTIKFANEIDETEAKMIIEKMKNNINFSPENFA